MKTKGDMEKKLIFFLFSIQTRAATTQKGSGTTSNGLKVAESEKTCKMDLNGTVVIDNSSAESRYGPQVCVAS